MAAMTINMLATGKRSSRVWANEWSSIKGAAASCFDDLETRLKGKEDESGSGSKPEGDKGGNNKASDSNS